MAGEVTVDALPYVDTGYDEPGIREAALALVEEETRRYRPTKNYLEHLPPVDVAAFETEIMKTEFERLSHRQPMEMLNMKRYELPQPPAGKMNDLTAWKDSVENSIAQLEHQASRISNLELLSEFGAAAWKAHNETLSHMIELQQKQLAETRRKIQEINWQRKRDQTSAGEKLKALEDGWVGLVSKNYEIEIACAELEKQFPGPFPGGVAADAEADEPMQ